MTSDPFKLFCPYQIAWGNDTAGVRLGVKSRRIGWTYKDAFDAIVDRVGTHPAKPYDCWYSATDMSAAEEYIGYCGDWLGLVNRVAKVIDDVIEVAGDKPGEKEKINVKRVVLDNGLRITAGSSNPKFFRSKGGEVKLDELAFHDRGHAMYKAAHASARFWRYPLAAWSSHNGPVSFFNQIVNQAVAGKLKASVHKVTILDAVEQGICERIRMRTERLTDIPPVDEAYRAEWLSDMRAECPDEDTWNEEYLCIPSTDAGSFLDYEMIRKCQVANLELWDLPSSANPWPTGRQLFAGADIAPRGDLFCVWVWERIGDVYWLRLCHTRRGIKFSEMEGVIDSIMPYVYRLCQDQTSIGEQLAERMETKWRHRYEGVIFSAPVKIDLAMPFRQLFEDGRARIPMDSAIVEDLHSVRKIVTAAGNTRFDVEESDTDGHADRFWAAALATHAAGNNKKPIPKASANMGDFG